MSQGQMVVGNIGFNLCNIDRANFDGKSKVLADVEIVLLDTCGKSHPLKVRNIELLIGTLCEFKDLEENCQPSAG